MKAITRDVDNILSIKEKEKILEEIHQKDLIDLFKKGFKPQYKRVESKKTILDQQISIAIDTDEKNMIALELICWQWGISFTQVTTTPCGVVLS